jgi:hypothetical protein
MQAQSRVALLFRTQNVSGITHPGTTHTEKSPVVRQGFLCLK